MILRPGAVLDAGESPVPGLAGGALEGILRPNRRMESGDVELIISRAHFAHPNGAPRDFVVMQCFGRALCSRCIAHVGDRKPQGSSAARLLHNSYSGDLPMKGQGCAHVLFRSGERQIAYIERAHRLSLNGAPIITQR